MKKHLDAFLNGYQYLIEHYNFPDRSIVWFRRLVYTILALKMLFVWPELDAFFNFISLRGHVPRTLKIFYTEPISNYRSMFWLLMCAVVCLGIVLKRRLWLSILIFAFSFMYLRLVSIASNNGDTIIDFFIFMLIFIREGADRGTARQMVNNIFLVTLQLFFCMIYFINGLGKLVKPFWRDGSFMQDVWFYPFYAQRGLIPLWLSDHWVALGVSWSVMVFEIVFAVLIWFRPFKKMLFTIGILFHIGIALLLSLPDFAACMIVGYLLFTQVDIIKEIEQFRLRTSPQLNKGAGE